MNLKDFAIKYVLCIHITLSIFSFEQTYFTQLNMASFGYDTNHKNLTTTSSISCATACRNLVQACTHAVITTIGDKNINCLLVEAGNGTRTLAIGGDEMQLWQIGKHVCNLTRARDLDFGLIGIDLFIKKRTFIGI